MNFAIGIDLGTTYSCISVKRENRGRPETIANFNGDFTTPSWVLFQDDQRIVGKNAKTQSPQNIGNTVFNVKRFIGRGFDDLEVQLNKTRMPFNIIHVNGKPRIEVRENVSESNTSKLVGQFAPEDISSYVLKSLKDTAECYLNTDVTQAVITVPANFSDNQRRATIDAANRAGLEVLGLLNEPTAAAIAYGYDIKERSTILVFDFGGGTLDVTILKIENGFRFQSVATSGDMHLGGEDFDEKILDYFIEDFWKQHHIRLREVNKEAVATLRLYAEEAKQQLSSDTSYKMKIPKLHEKINFTTTLTRGRFENLCTDILKRILKPVMDVLKESGISYSNIDKVVMVGGSSKIPMVQEKLETLFSCGKICKDISPDQAISHGAALQAYAILNKNVPMIGARIIVIDVTGASFGIEIIDKSVTKVVPRNTQYPCKLSKVFVTSFDNQTEVCFAIYQGENQMAVDNTLIGKFEITGLPPKPKGFLKFDVTFTMDEDGILNVNAVNPYTGKYNDITITFRH